MVDEKAEELLGSNERNLVRETVASEERKGIKLISMSKSVIVLTVGLG